jgi:hypothetical protein
MRIKIAVIALALTVVSANARDKHPKPEPQDAIEIVAHVPLTSGPVRRFLTTQHFSRTYLYAEHNAGENVTLIDVTKATHPVVLADVSYGAQGNSDSLFAVTGTAALVVAGQPAAQQAPQSVKIMSFSDPQHPTVAHEFTGVTAMTRDEARGLIFIADANGVWILHQQFAPDPEVEAAYAHHVIYDH